MTSGRAQADERYKRLLASVGGARDLLVRVGETHWSSWIDAVRRDLTAHDAYGLSRLLAAYGGMGSFSDLVIHPANGHAIDEAEIKQVNQDLDQLRAEMHDDATALLRDIERAT